MRIIQIRPAIRFALLAALLASARPAHAQEDADTVAIPRGRPVEFVGGGRIGWPQKLSGYVGVVLVRERYESGYSGSSLVLEPGLGGGSIGLGWTTVGSIGMTARTQLALLRTWGDPWLVGPDATYVGADARFTVGYIGFGVGAYIRAPDSNSDPAPLLTASFVFGS